METLIAILNIAAITSPLIPVIIGLLKFKDLTKPFIFLWLMAVFASAVSLYSTWQFNLRINNIPSLYLLIVAEIILGGIFIIQSVSKKYFKIIIATLIAISVSNTIYVSLIAGDIDTHNPLNRSLQGYFMVIFSLFYFYDLLKNRAIVSLKNDPTFWIVTAFFFYFGTTQFLFLFNDFVIAYNNEVKKLIWKGHYIICTIYYVLLGIGLWKKK